MTKQNLPLLPMNLKSKQIIFPSNKYLVDMKFFASDKKYRKNLD